MLHVAPAALAALTALAPAQTSPAGSLEASNTDAGVRFGAATALSGDTLVGGAPGEVSRANGAVVHPSDSSAPDEDSTSMGPQSDPYNDLAPSAGADFAFEFAPPPVLCCTAGTCSSVYTPTLVASSAPRASPTIGFVV